jgi:hypothetical protein
MSDTGPLLQPSEDALRNLCYADVIFKQRYEGWELVGRGAFATVVRVRFMGEPVALKVFGHLTDEGRKRFRAEFANAVRLTSPSVVRTYSAFEHGSVAWIEMEAIDGPNLKEELERRQSVHDPFTLEQSLEIALAVAGVLVEAHRAQIVHRDIKPANILLPRSGKPVAKLGDFGIARLVGAAKLTATGAFPGTPHFGAPEAFAGKPLGPPADLYSLSLCLFSLFTNNRFPFLLDDEAPLEALIAAHVKKTPLRMRAFIATLPEELDALVLRGLEKNPARRPTAGELVEGLEEVRDRARPRSAPTAPEHAAPTRLPRLILLGFVLMCVLLYLRVGRFGEATVARGSPVPTPEAPRREKVRSVEALHASVREGFVHIANGPSSLSGVRVTLLTEGGREHRALVAGLIEPFGTADLALDGFAPPIEAGARIEEIEVRAEGKPPLEAHFRAPFP